MMLQTQVNLGLLTRHMSCKELQRHEEREQ